MDDSRRKHLRLNTQVSIFIDYYEKSSCDQLRPHLLVTESIDISSGGLKFHVQKPLKNDAIYHIGLQVEENIFQLVVQTQWLAAVGDGYMVGMKLLDSDGTDIIRWKRWVAEQHMPEHKS